MNPVDKDILRLALPSILANITVPIVGMVDMAVSGHLSDSGGGAAAFIGAVSAGSMIFDLLYWNLSFLRSGTGGITAQAYGRGDFRAAARIAVRSIGVAFALSLLVLALQGPFLKAVFLFLDCSPEVKELAVRYFNVRVWAAPAAVSLMSLRGWFIGMQDSVSSMWTDLIVNVVNASASIILTLGIGGWRGIGFPGIAWGTLLAQYSGLTFALLTLAFKYREVFVPLDAGDILQAFSGPDLRAFFRLNTDLFVRSLGLTAIYVGFTTISAGLGDLALASGAIIMKILMIFSFFTDGFAYAGEALCGRYIGRGLRDMVSLSIRKVFVWSLSIAVAFIFIYLWGSMPLVQIMTPDSEVQAACRSLLPWLLLMPPLGCAAFTWDGIFQGAACSKPIRNSMVFSALAFFGIWVIFSSSTAPVEDGAFHSASMHLLMGAYFAHLLVRAVYLTVKYKRNAF